MSKIKTVIEEYKKTYKEVLGEEPPEVVQKGSWIVIDDGKPIRAKQLEAATAMYQKETLKPLKDYDIYKPEKKATATEILSSYDDVGMIAEAIRIKADDIRHSRNMNDMRRKGHEIVKLAKRILNLQGE
jgi:hypothetical protein